MMNNSSYGRNQLPPWFCRPEPERGAQHSLFTDNLAEVLANFQVSVDELNRWHENGWISFGSEFHEGLESWHVNEIRFVRDVVRSGLSDAYVRFLFDQLPRPMDFDPASIAYSFSLGWVEADSPSEPDPDEIISEHVEEWLGNLAEEGDVERLIELKEYIEGLLSANRNADEETQE